MPILCGFTESFHIKGKVGILTDLDENDPCFRSLQTLFEDGFVKLSSENAAQQLEQCIAAVVLHKTPLVKSALDAVARYAEHGGNVFMDIRNFAQWQETRAVLVQVGPSTEGVPVKLAPENGADKVSVENRMTAGLRIVENSIVTSGFRVGQIIPRASSSGELLVLPRGFTRPKLDVLAVTNTGEAGLIRLPVGEGVVVAADVLSLDEPHCRKVGSYYKYTLITNATTNPVRFGKYYDKRFTYDELVKHMKEIADSFPGITFKDEGPASEDYRIYSLNMGRPDAPLYFLYAAAHGTEWEPGYGLMTFAKHVAQGHMKDIIDLNRISIRTRLHGTNLAHSSN